MDKLLGQDKENFLTFPMFSLPAGNFAQIDDNQSKINGVTRAKGKSKTQKAATNSVRAGDWICLLCNNLNFSFRAECNRCGLQTKKENYIQNLLQISEPTATTVSATDRKALKDLTNTQHLPKDLMFPAEEKEQKAPYELPPGLDLSLNRSHSAEYTDDKPFGFHSNFGFNSVLLLTPPKGAANTLTAQQNTYEKSESRNNMLPPYQSPQQQLPSISPILRKIFDNEAKDAALTFKERLGNKPKIAFKRNLDFSESEAGSKGRFSFSYGEEPSNEGTYFKEIDNFVRGEESKNSNLRIPLTNTHCEGVPKQLTKLNCNSVHQNAIQFGCNLQKISLPFLEDFAQKKNPHQQSYHQHQHDQIQHHHHHQQQQQSLECITKKERKSDWVCNKCGNLNYSFRKFCNRCQTDI